MSFFFLTPQTRNRVVPRAVQSSLESVSSGWSTVTPRDEEREDTKGTSIFLDASETDEEEKEDIASVNSSSLDVHASYVDEADPKADELEIPKASANPEHRPYVTLLKTQCEALASKAAAATDNIAGALSEKLSSPHSNFRFRIATPEQSLARCERYKDEAHRLYKRFEREAYAGCKKLDNEEYEKWEKLDEENRAARIRSNAVRLKAEKQHKANPTVANYSKWKRIETNESERSRQLRKQSDETWDEYNRISRDAWKIYKLGKEDARDGYDAVRTEYKRAKRLMNHLTDPCDWPFWKKATCVVGTALAAPLVLTMLGMGIDYLVRGGNSKESMSSEAIGNLVKGLVKEEIEDIKVIKAVPEFENYFITLAI